MPVDLTNAPVGIAEYAETLRGRTNGEVFGRVKELAECAFIGGVDTQQSDEHWIARCDLAELERRLGGWLGGEGLPEYAKFTTCPKCGEGQASGGSTKEAAQGSAISTKHCAGGVNDNRKLCYGREGEHFHRGCPNCGYEWLEAVATRR